MDRNEPRSIAETTIQVPLCTSEAEARWLAAMLPYLATVIFDRTDTTCVLTAPGHVKTHARRGNALVRRRASRAWQPGLPAVREPSGR